MTSCMGRSLVHNRESHAWHHGLWASPGPSDNILNMDSLSSSIYIFSTWSRSTIYFPRETYGLPREINCRPASGTKNVYLRAKLSLFVIYCISWSKSMITVHLDQLRFFLFEFPAKLGSLPNFPLMQSQIMDVLCSVAVSTPPVILETVWKDTFLFLGTLPNLAGNLNKKSI